MADVTAFLETGEIAWSGKNGSAMKRVRCDFSATNVSAADVVQIFTIAAGTHVHNVYTKVVTAEGATATGDLGDGADPNGYNDAINLNGTAGAWEAPAQGTDAFATSNGKFYTAADTIDLVPDHDLDTAVMDFYIHYTELTEIAP